jgi:cytochrome c oxidase assembly factor 2
MQNVVAAERTEGLDNCSVTAALGKPRSPGFKVRATPIKNKQGWQPKSLLWSSEIKYSYLLLKFKMFHSEALGKSRRRETRQGLVIRASLVRPQAFKKPQVERPTSRQLTFGEFVYCFPNPCGCKIRLSEYDICYLLSMLIKRSFNWPFTAYKNPIMPPALHPRSRLTSSLFATTLFASFFVVALPHVLPCPAPRVAYADGEMSPDGTLPKRRRRRRCEGEQQQQLKDGRGAEESSDDRESVSAGETSSRKSQRECPVPKPGGIVGEILGFRAASSNDGKGSSRPP